MTKDEIEFKNWKAAKVERERKRGAYWLTKEGRQELRDCFPDHDDGNAVRPLLDYVDRLEARLAAVEEQAKQWTEFHAPSRNY
jgi:hypothetical protein